MTPIAPIRELDRGQQRAAPRGHGRVAALKEQPQMTQSAPIADWIVASTMLLAHGPACRPEGHPPIAPITPIRNWIVVKRWFDDNSRALIVVS